MTGTIDARTAMTMVMRSSPQTASSGNRADDADAQQLAKLRQACNGVESLFLSELLKTMRDSVQESGLFPKSPGSDIMESLFDQRVSQVLANGSGSGLGEMIFNQMIRQEGLEDGGESVGNTTPGRNRRVASYEMPSAADGLGRLSGSADATESGAEPAQTNF